MILAENMSFKEYETMYDMYYLSQALPPAYIHTHPLLYPLVPYPPLTTASDSVGAAASPAQCKQVSSSSALAPLPLLLRRVSLDTSRMRAQAAGDQVAIQGKLAAR